ncbi:MAG: 50S ribosomal protein L17 [bacterium]
MRHRKKGKKFHRIASKRRPFLRNLASNLVRTEKIETTEARAKALRPIVERWITCAKPQTLAARRFLLRRVHNGDVVEKLYSELGPRYASRSGGYTRIVKLGRSRKRDGARLARIEFV